MEPATPTNRTCQACRISKIKCDMTSVATGARCKRCERLDLRCVIEARGNLSTGASRLRAPGVCALKRGACDGASSATTLSTRPCTVGAGAGGAGAVELLKHLVLVMSHGSPCENEAELLRQLVARLQAPQAPLRRAVLRWCSRLAWSRNDTALMAWVLEQAARHHLPLADFAPGASLGAIGPALDAAGTPPPYVRELMRGGLAVAFVALDGATFWTANESFDERVCRRATLHGARERSTCEVTTTYPPCAPTTCNHHATWQVSALFAPVEEVEPFETQVIGPLVEALAPCGAAEGGAPADLQSELVDTSGRWRLRFAPGVTLTPPLCHTDTACEGLGDGPAAAVGGSALLEAGSAGLGATGEEAFVCCDVSFRCAVLRGGAEMWVVGCYKPQRTADGAWRTSKSADGPIAWQAGGRPTAEGAAEAAGAEDSEADAEEVLEGLGVDEVLRLFS